MINLTEEERAVGRENYYSAVTAHDQMHRRDFLVKSIVAGGATAAGVGAMYFGYQQPSRQIRVCVIGTGDEGSVLMGAINPDYVQVTSICDIRPSSIHRAFHGAAHNVGDCEIFPRGDFLDRAMFFRGKPDVQRFAFSRAYLCLAD